jgi:hypothetical protein
VAAYGEAALRLDRDDLTALSHLKGDKAHVGEAARILLESLPPETEKPPLGGAYAIGMAARMAWGEPAVQEEEPAPEPTR